MQKKTHLGAARWVVGLMTRTRNLALLFARDRLCPSNLPELEVCEKRVPFFHSFLPIMTLLGLFRSWSLGRLIAFCARGRHNSPPSISATGSFDVICGFPCPA